MKCICCGSELGPHVEPCTACGWNPQAVHDAMGGYQIGDAVRGRYEICESLGVGRLGTVLRALDTEQGLELALKLIHPGLLPNAELSRLFVAGLRPLTKLVSEDLARVYAVESEQGRIFVARELMEGRSLQRAMDARRAQGKAFVAQEVVSIVEQITRALRATGGTVHGSLTPGKVWLRKEEILLVDFGLAPLLSSAGLWKALQRGGRLRGYIAPEIARGAALTAAADVFALGVMIGEMLTCTVFDGRLGCFKEAVPDLPPEIEALLAVALSAEPRARFQNPAELLASLCDATGIAGTSLASSPDTRVDRSPYFEEPPLDTRAKSLPHSQDFHPAEEPTSELHTQPQSKTAGGAAFVRKAPAASSRRTSSPPPIPVVEAKTEEPTRPASPISRDTWPDDPDHQDSGLHSTAVRLPSTRAASPRPPAEPRPSLPDTDSATVPARADVLLAVVEESRAEPMPRPILQSSHPGRSSRPPEPAPRRAAPPVQERADDRLFDPPVEGTPTGVLEHARASNQRREVGRADPGAAPRREVTQEIDISDEQPVLVAGRPEVTRELSMSDIEPVSATRGKRISSRPSAPDYSGVFAVDMDRDPEAELDQDNATKELFRRAERLEGIDPRLVRAAHSLDSDRRKEQSQHAIDLAHTQGRDLDGVDPRLLRAAAKLEQDKAKKAAPAKPPPPDSDDEWRERIEGEHRGRVVSFLAPMFGGGGGDNRKHPKRRPRDPEQKPPPPPRGAPNQQRAGHTREPNRPTPRVIHDDSDNDDDYQPTIRVRAWQNPLKSGTKLPADRSQLLESALPFAIGILFVAMSILLVIALTAAGPKFEETDDPAKVGGK